MTGKAKQRQIDPHHPVAHRGLPWPICAHCGLVYLKNIASAWAMKHGCDYKENPAWPNVLRESVDAAGQGRYR